MVDVTFALLLVSASIGVLAVFLTDDEPAHDPIQADRTAETLAATTGTINYTLEPVKSESAFTDNGYDYDRSTHGTLTGMLAEAAVTNAHFPDGDASTAYDPDDATYLTKAGRDYEVAVDGAVRDALTSAGVDAHVVAIWTPYRNSAIEGRVEAGAERPAGVDTSTATLTVSSKMPALDDAELERAFRLHQYAGVSRLIAASIVEGYFPETETQLALEGDSLGRGLAVYRYQRMAAVVDHGGFDTNPSIGGSSARPVSRTQADAATANSQLAGELQSMIYQELTSKYPPAPSADPEEIAEAVSVGEVKLTITTWHE